MPVNIHFGTALMTELNTEKLTRKIKIEISKRFSIVDEEMKKDLFQEAFLGCLESDEREDDKIHWVIVRTLSKFYWANISIVKRVPVRKNKATSDRLAPKEDRQEVFDLALDDSDINEQVIDFTEKNEESLKRVSREYFLIPQAKRALSTREWQIIKKRIITRRDKQATRNDLAVKLSISTERVRQIEIKGLNKLKGFLGNPENPLHILHPGY